LERHRKYIIAAIEILAGDYPCLAEYMKPQREEQDR
jgi:RNA polymerase sigma factor